MKSSEFKIKVAELINITLEAEKKRYKIMSNSRLRRAGVNFKKIATDVFTQPRISCEAIHI